MRHCGPRALRSRAALVFRSVALLGWLASPDAVARGKATLP